jgi:hypothetical protein
MPHSVIYRGDLAELLAETEKQAIDFLGGGECARLPQELTNVGHTSRWQRGPRVLDSPHLLPGTVIANFKLVDGKWKYPNEHHYHSGLFVRFFHKAKMTNGMPCEFGMLDQWQGGKPKIPGERGLSILPDWFKKKRPDMDHPSNRADEFYVVLVP